MRKFCFKDFVCTFDQNSKMVNQENIDKTQVILGVAQRRFAQYGFLKTSMTEIASDAGMSKASLYYYFEDKDAIFKEVIKNEQEGFISQIEKFIHSEATASKLLIIYVKKRLEYFELFLNLSKLNAESIKTVKPIFNELSGKFNEKEILLVSKIISAGVRNGEFEKANSKELATLFVRLIQSLRSNVILRSGIENINTIDFHQLMDNCINTAKIFGNGIKRKK